MLTKIIIIIAWITIGFITFIVHVKQNKYISFSDSFDAQTDLLNCLLFGPFYFFGAILIWFGGIIDWIMDKLIQKINHVKVEEIKERDEESNEEDCDEIYYL